MTMWWRRPRPTWTPSGSGGAWDRSPSCSARPSRWPTTAATPTGRSPPSTAWCGTLGVMAVDARVGHVGSLLRPQYLRDAREAYAQGALTPAGFKAAEDRAVREIVAMQEALGLPAANA